MTTAGKRRLVHAALAAFTLWPALQIALVKTQGLSAWKLAGWGMYATPQRQPGLVARGITREGQLVPLARPHPAALREELARFQRWRSALGRLFAPERLARAILASQPELARVELEVVELELDARSGKLEALRTPYSYPRASD